MLKLIQLLLNLVTRLILLYCIFIFVIIAWPISGIFGGFILYWKYKNPRRESPTDLGSAKWAEEIDLLQAGMIGASRGLILGRLPRRGNRNNQFQFTAHRKDPLIRLPNSVHNIICGPTGSGKGVSFVIPTLHTEDRSTVVMDFKGEIASQTAAYREKRFGHRCILLDPYKIVTQTPDRWNNLDQVHKESPLAIDDCNDISSSLVHRSGQEKDPHFLDSAEAMLAAVTATVVGYGEPGTRSLLTVQEILSSPRKLGMAIEVMTKSKLWNGALSNLGGQLSHYVDREKASVLTTSLRFLRFLGTPAIAECTSSSSFDPADLLKGKMTIYCIVPPERAYALSGLLRLWIGSLIRINVKGGLQ